LNLGLGNPVLKNAKEVPYLPSRWCIANPARSLEEASNHLKLACDSADCTTLYYGGSCYGIGQKENVSFAFNSYYQRQKQDPKSCDFDGHGMITYLDPSVGECRFLVAIDDSKSSAVASCGGGCCGVFCGVSILTLWVLMYLRMMGSA
jgi:hypothetical protein